jgi:hypothetical protein
MNPFFRHRFSRLVRWQAGQPRPDADGDNQPVRTAASWWFPVLRALGGLLFFCFAALAVLVPVAVAVAMLLRGVRKSHLAEGLGGAVMLISFAAMVIPLLRPLRPPLPGHNLGPKKD